MTKKFLSVFTAMVMSVYTFTGCSDLDKEGNLKEASSYETVEIVKWVEYDVRSDFKKGELLDNYHYDNDTVFRVFGNYNFYGSITNEVLIEHYNRIYADKQNCSYEIIKCGRYDVIAYSYDTDENERYTLYITNGKDYVLSGFGVEVTYPKDKDENLIRQLAFEIIESARTYGNIKRPKTEFECDYFSINIPDEYTIFSSVATENDNAAHIIYFDVDTLAEEIATLTLEAITDSEYNSAEEYIREIYFDSTENFDFVEDISETEILGFDGYSVMYYDNDSWRRTTIYAFEKNDVIYSFEINNSDTDGHEQVQADFEKLIDCIKIK